MLGVYRDYLLILRNSLIREGVPLKVDDLKDYTDVYYFGEKLNDIIWFYSVLALGNSRCRLRGFFWKLDKKYIEEITKEIRDEYLEEAKLFNEVSSDGFLERKRRSKGISEVNIPNEGYIPSEGADESAMGDSVGDEVRPSPNEVKEPSNSGISNNEVSEKVKLDIVDEDGWLSYKGKVLKGSETPANEGNKGVIFDDEGWGEEEVENSEDGWVDDFEDDEEEEEDIDFPEMGDDEEDSEDSEDSEDGDGFSELDDEDADFPELDDEDDEESDDEDEEESDDDFPEMPDDEDDDDFPELGDEDDDFPELDDEEEEDEEDIDFPEMGDDDDEDVDFPEMSDDEEDDDFPELGDEEEDDDFPEMSDEDDDEDEDVDFPEMSDDDDEEEEDVDFPEMEDDDDDVDFPEMEDDDDDEDVDFPEMDDDDVDFPEMEDDEESQDTTELVGDDFTSTGVLSESQGPQKKKVSLREVQEEAFAKSIESTAEGIVKFASNTFNKFRNGNKEKPAVRRHEEIKDKRVKK